MMWLGGCTNPHFRVRGPGTRARPDPGLGARAPRSAYLHIYMSTFMHSHKHIQTFMHFHTDIIHIRTPTHQHDDMSTHQALDLKEQGGPNGPPGTPCITTTFPSPPRLPPPGRAGPARPWGQESGGGGANVVEVKGGSGRGPLGPPPGCLRSTALTFES